MKRGSRNRAVSFLKGFIVFMFGIIVGLLLLTVVLNKSNKKENPKGTEITGLPDEDDTEKSEKTTEQTEEVTTEEITSEEITEEITTEEVTEELTEEDQDDEPSGSDEDIETILAGMSLHEKVCQMFVVTPESLTGAAAVTEFGDMTKSSLDAYPVGGLIYFDQNLVTADQTTQMLQSTQAYARETTGIPIILSVDEEGGSVARCGSKLGVTKLNSMYDYKDQGTDTAYNNAGIISSYLLELGFNLDYAPVADVWSNPNNTVIGKRAYSDDFNEASTLVASAVKGFQSNGIKCTLKHFPGHGDTNADSHTSSATTSKTADQLMSQEYLPFISGIQAGAEVVMVGHITVTSITSEPASISKDIVTGELRGKLGFDGVVITDALNMGAVSNLYSSGELAIKCIEAGDDLLLMPTDFKSAVSAVESAVESGQISEDRIDASVRRILTLKKSWM